jgi:hypothetical protein
MSLPERINVIRTVTYSVPEIVEDLKQEGEENVDLERVMEIIEGWAWGDMMAPPSRHDIVFQDENGEEL